MRSVLKSGKKGMSGEQLQQHSDKYAPTRTLQLSQLCYLQVPAAVAG